MRLTRGLMQRREFIAGLGGAAAAWPVGARAQKSVMPIVGLLGTATPSTWGPWTAVFIQRLHDLGWIEGRNVAIEVRWAEGRPERFAEIASEFVRLKVDVIFTSGGAVTVAKQATSIVPIVFALAKDPLGTGLVASLARPGGNVTGISAQSTYVVGKRLELLREVIPRLRRLAIMANVGNPNVAEEMSDVQVAARTLGLEVATSEIRRAEDIPPTIEALKGHADALYVCIDPFVITNRVRINTLALAAQLPTIYSQREFVDAGGFMSYGANIPVQFRRAADFVDKILRGAKPAELPVEQPTKFDLVINLTTARALGLTVSPTMLARADEVIE